MHWLLQRKITLNWLIVSYVDLEIGTMLAVCRGGFIIGAEALSRVTDVNAIKIVDKVLKGH